jgi:hypothetical protein
VNVSCCVFSWIGSVPEPFLEGLSAVECVCRFYYCRALSRYWRDVVVSVMLLVS